MKYYIIATVEVLAYGRGHYMVARASCPEAAEALYGGEVIEGENGPLEFATFTEADDYRKAHDL